MPRPSFIPNARSIEHQVISSGFASGTGYVLVFLLHIWMAKVGGAAEYGRFAVIAASLLILQATLPLGSDKVLLRELPKSIGGNRQSAALSRLAFTTPIATWSVFLLCVPFLDQSGVIDGLYRDTPLKVIITLSLVMCYIQVLGSAFVVAQKSHTFYFAAHLLRPALAISAFWLFKSWMHAFEAMIFSHAISHIFVILFLLIRLPRDLLKTKSTTVRIASDYLRPLLFIGAIPFISVLSQQFDLIYAGYFLDNDSTGSYALIKRFAALIFLPTIIVGSMVTARISMANIDKNGEHTQVPLEDWRKLYALSSSAGVAASILFVAIYPSLSLELGSSFPIGKQALLFVAGGFLIRVIVGPVGAVLLSIGAERFLFFTNLLSMIIALIIIILLAEDIGIFAFALALFSHQLILSFASVLYVRFKLTTFRIDCIKRFSSIVFLGIALYFGFEFHQGTILHWSLYPISVCTALALAYVQYALSNRGYYE